MDHQLSKEELRLNKIKKEEFRNIKRTEIYVVLESLKCAHNIGTILRLSDALLIKKVYICGNTIIPPNGKIKSSSRGAEKWVHWEYIENAIDIVSDLKKNDIEIVAVELTSNSIDYRKYQPKKSVCLIFGREFDGVSNELIELSNQIVHLPILGMANSINVSTAASVIIYDVFDKMNR